MTDVDLRAACAAILGVKLAQRDHHKAGCMFAEVDGVLQIWDPLAMDEQAAGGLLGWLLAQGCIITIQRSDMMVDPPEGAVFFTTGDMSKGEVRRRAIVRAAVQIAGEKKAPPEGEA